MTPSKAYRLVRDALKRGELSRPDKCERCGATPEPAVDGRSRIQGHHADYSKPLNLERICAKCHRAETPLPVKPGAPNYGEKNGSSKLTEADVLTARRLREEGLTYKAIADRFSVDKRTAMRAIKGEQWKQLAAAPTALAVVAPPKMTDEQADAIYALWWSKQNARTFASMIADARDEQWRAALGGTV